MYTAPTTLRPHLRAAGLLSRLCPLDTMVVPWWEWIEYREGGAGASAYVPCKSTAVQEATPGAQQGRRRTLNLLSWPAVRC